MDSSALTRYKVVSGAVLHELGKNKDIRLVSDRKDATIYLGVNAVVPDDVNELTKSNYVVLSYISSVLSSFVTQPAQGGKKP